MSNFEIANRVMTRFLARVPSRKPKDILKYELDGAFNWASTEEGWKFWYDLHSHTFDRKARMFHQFMREYYFNDKPFIRLRTLL